MKHFYLSILALLIVLAWQPQAQAAIGCTLTNPAQDLKFLFPEVTSFREEVREFRMLENGQQLYEELRKRLGGDLDPVYESFDTPFTVYSVYQGETLIGIVHGVNIPGRGGVIQVFLSTDPKTGAIRQFFFQRLESRVARSLRDKRFRERFNGLSLADFYMHDYFSQVDPGHGSDKVGAIDSPLAKGQDDFDYRSTLRGIRKNLILLDYFVYAHMNEPFYERASTLLQAKPGDRKN